MHALLRTASMLLLIGCVADKTHPPEHREPGDSFVGACREDASLDPDAIYVDATNGADIGTGTDIAPVRTVGRAVALATERKRMRIYLGEGRYEEAVLFPESSVLLIRGGVQRQDSGWRLRCDAAAPGRTVIAGGIETRATRLGLRALTVEQNGQATNVATRVHSGSLLELRDSVLHAGPGLVRGPGGVGGASVALSVAAGASVRVRSSILVAEDGGWGAPGGDSIAVVRADESARVSIDQHSALMHGAPGHGADAAPEGIAATIHLVD